MSTGHNLKWDHFEILARGRLLIHHAPELGPLRTGLSRQTVSQIFSCCFFFSFVLVRGWSVVVVRGPVHKVVRSGVHGPVISVVYTIKVRKIIGIALFVDPL